MVEGQLRLEEDLLKVDKVIYQLKNEMRDTQMYLSQHPAGAYKGFDPQRQSWIQRLNGAIKRKQELELTRKDITLRIEAINRLDRAARRAAEPPRAVIQADAVAVLVRRVRDQDLRLAARVAAAEELIRLLLPGSQEGVA